MEAERHPSCAFRVPFSWIAPGRSLPTALAFRIVVFLNLGFGRGDRIVTFSVPATPGRSLPAALAFKIVVFLKVFN